MSTWALSLLNSPTVGLVNPNLRTYGRRSKSLCLWRTWPLISVKVPVQLHLMRKFRGQSNRQNWHISSCSRMRAIGKVSVHPCGLLEQGHSTGINRFSSALFRVSESSSLQFGHFWIFCLQLLQMLCPLPHNAMGGSMYCMQTGHSSCSSTSLDRP